MCSHGFDHSASWPAKVRNVSRLGSQLSKPQAGFELHLKTLSAKPRFYGAAMLKQTRELFHCKPGLSNQRSKSSFGQLSMVGNGESSVRWLYVPKNNVAAMLLIKIVSSFLECLDSVATGNNR